MSTELFSCRARKTSLLGRFGLLGPTCRAWAAQSSVRSRPGWAGKAETLTSFSSQRKNGAKMPSLTAADASLVLEHVLGDAAIPSAAAHVLLAALPSPSPATPRLLRAILLRRLSSDPVSSASLDSLYLLASLPKILAPARLAAAHLAVAAHLAASAPDFDAAAQALFARPDGRARRALEGSDAPVLVSPEAAAAADQFEAAIGDAFSQTVLRGLWGDRAVAEERVRELVAAEWAAIGPSRLDVAAERIVGDGAVETWRAADQSTRAKYRVLAGEERTRDILSKLGEPTSHVNPVPTPEVCKVMDALKSSCADLRSAMEDPLPAAMMAANEVLAARMNKAVDLNVEEVTSQPVACSAGGPTAPNDKGKRPRKGTPHSLMDWNPTARAYQWDDSNEHDSEGSQASLRRPRLTSPRKMAISPLQPAENKAKRRKTRKWSMLEEETLRKGVEQFGSSNWKDILANHPDVFIGRTAVDLKDKWRNMARY